MKISTIVFDFGNVVAFFSHLKAAQQLAAHSELAAEAIQALVFAGQLEHAYESGQLTTEQLLQHLRQHCRLTGSDHEIGLAYADMFEPNPDVCAAVPRLRERYRLLLLSNTNELHFEQLSRQFADTLRFFDALVLSHQVGVRKPNRRIYDHCRELAGCPAAECLFIDDLPANVAAAQEAGWQGLVYRRGDRIQERLAEVGIYVRTQEP